MIVLAEESLEDFSPSTQWKAKEYIRKEFGIDKIHEIHINDELSVLEMFKSDKVKCIMLNNIAEYTATLQKALKSLILEASKSKVILIMLDESKHDEAKCPLIGIADRTIKFEHNNYSNATLADYDYHRKRK